MIQLGCNLSISLNRHVVVNRTVVKKLDKDKANIFMLILSLKPNLPNTIMLKRLLTIPHRESNRGTYLFRTSSLTVCRGCSVTYCDIFSAGREVRLMLSVVCVCSVSRYTVFVANITPIGPF